MSDSKFNLGDALETFFIESREMLDEMEENLLNLEKSGTDDNSLNALFRSVHTIKGSSGMFGLEAVEKFTHVVENLLDDLRNEKLALTSDMIGSLLNSHDYIVELIDFYERGDETLDANKASYGKALMDELISYSSSEKKPGPLQPGGETESDGGEEELSSETEGEMFYVSSEAWHISLRFEQDVFKHSLDPQSFISYLEELGKVIKVKTVYDDVPELEEMDPENCYLGFEIVFKGDTTKDNLSNVFEFIRDDCSISIIPPRSSIVEFVNLIEKLPETPMKIGDMLIEVGSLTEAELRKVLELQQKFISSGGETDKRRPNKFIGEIIVDEKMVHKPVVEAALQKQKVIHKTEEKRKKTIRIDPDKIDNLINLVGELVITGANVKQHADDLADAGLLESVSTMIRLIEDIRDGTMTIRMVQIGETFKRFERIVRDLSREKGKDIELIINGGETELDKTLIEKITDPLMHLVRNAADHGIQTPDKRVQTGKPAKGTIILDAYHETGSVVIEVKDDGAGLNRDKIYKKAVEKEIINDGETIDDNDLFQFIFEPGFSTAEKVTNISGRGVGMDVVKRNIEALRGMIEINSELGAGTSVKINLPLTLAIIDGFMVKIADAHYIFPLDMVTECIEITPELNTEIEENRFIRHREDLLPVMGMQKFFELGEPESLIEKYIVVLEYAKLKAGVIVDLLKGEFQTVIKPVGSLFRNMKWISGATILGNGEVALIMDVPMLIQYIKEHENDESPVSKK